MNKHNAIIFVKKCQNHMNEKVRKKNYIKIQYGKKNICVRHKYQNQNCNCDLKIHIFAIIEGEYFSFFRIVK